MAPSILVVDDEVAVLNLIESRLSSEGFRVVKALSVRSATQRLASEHFQIVIIDVGLPDGDGLDLVRKVRTSHNSGIIVISGRGEIADRVVGLELGADDYIVKPFHLRDLLARVRAVGRRLPDATEQSRPRSGTNARRAFCGCEIDPSTRQVKGVDGKELYLTSREFDVLWVLVENAPALLSRETIIQAAFGTGHNVGGRPVDGLISRLRAKLFPDGSGNVYITTVRGRGYQLMC